MYLQLENVEKYYGENENRVQVLKGVNGSIERGEICVMLGPSGSGKSTLLNLIGGIEIIDYGNVIVGGIDLASLSKTKLGLYPGYFGLCFPILSSGPKFNSKRKYWNRCIFE